MGCICYLCCFLTFFFAEMWNFYYFLYFFQGRFDGLLRERVGNGEKKKHVSVCVGNGMDGRGVEWSGGEGKVGERIF